ncbi:MAG TPA: hypothetical protein VMW92_00625 [Candidatus Heimdallarchaeota archaeon]|nr:hypothetical protein [Candidatus Heimdallarchaeota archaeon]
MKRMVFLLFLCFLLVTSVSAQQQDKVIGVHTEVKMVIEDEEPEVYAQVTTGDKPGTQMLACYAMDAEEYQWQMIELSENDKIFWVIEYTAVYNSDVRFHFIMNGPEFYQVLTSWTPSKYKTYYKTSLKTTNEWIKGTYTLTVIAEHRNNRSGAEAVGSCRVRLY